ncbi:hypothetical protein DL93DRAFT_2092306 [Clavulina sp. PMI_390]|nr:hypothetical protein DL93DRAFT_2092306 [Clavulina sp. PMI_390]
MKRTERKEERVKRLSNERQTGSLIVAQTSPRAHWLSSFGSSASTRASSSSVNSKSSSSSDAFLLVKFPASSNSPRRLY